MTMEDGIFASGYNFFKPKKVEKVLEVQNVRDRREPAYGPTEPEHVWLDGDDHHSVAIPSRPRTLHCGLAYPIALPSLCP